jgi:hypothetical protein
MIVTVRIAPLEQWCEPMRQKAPNPAFVGMPVEIDTTTAKKDVRVTCGETAWKVISLNGEKIVGQFACRHVLEMD